jgi:hypothetical protein
MTASGACCQGPYISWLACSLARSSTAGQVIDDSVGTTSRLQPKGKAVMSASAEGNLIATWPLVSLCF